MLKPNCETESCRVPVPKDIVRFQPEPFEITYPKTKENEFFLIEMQMDMDLILMEYQGSCN
jgi:hypothetical protein